MNAIQYYQTTIDATLKHFNTDLLQGLSHDEAAKRMTEYGENTLGDDSSISISKILIHQICNAMILVLFISMVITLAIQDWISGGVIAFVVFINVAIGSVQEYNASKTMNSLKSLSSPTARVIRDGNSETIPTRHVVPGDIVIVKVGDSIPADLRLVDSLNFETDEALLTGESLPVEKDHTQVYPEEVSPGDRLNVAYSSSTVTKGRATGIATTTGLNTEIGKIAVSLRGNGRMKREEDQSMLHWLWSCFKEAVGNFLGINIGTPLQRKLSKLAILLFGVAVVFAIVVMATQKYKVNKEVAIYAICVAVSMIPSSLVVVLTITMSVGAKVMSKRNVVVRNLNALESLGGVTNVASDKTGTLTKNAMIAKRVWIPQWGTALVEPGNDIYNPTDGRLSYISVSPYDFEHSEVDVGIEQGLPKQKDPLFQKWIECATLANIATVFQDHQTGEWKSHGDATETAIQVFTTRLNVTRDGLGHDHLAEFPFDSSIKRMSAIYKTNEGPTIFTKGAVERLLPICTQIAGPDGYKKMTQEDIHTIEKNVDTMSKSGLRVLSFATRKLEVNETNLKERNNLEKELTFLGLIGIYDPPRPEAVAAVKKFHTAGIAVHMVTGDHVNTATAIAKECGIVPHNLYHYPKEVIDSMIMTASDFDALSEDELDNLPLLPLVIARCSPQSKVRMIDALHRRGKFAAMTGDGVNDSPSLKRADVGIAMGINGSDVAKDASDIVLSDDNFASILNAVEEGRRMSENIQKFVLQLLAENVAQALYLMIGLAFLDEDHLSVFPLSPVEVLWIIVITSCFPAMGLGLQKAAPDLMEKSPNRAGVFTWEIIVDMIVYGFWMAVCCLACFISIIYGRDGGDLGYNCNSTYSASCNNVFKARAASFATMTWCALILAWEVVDLRRSFFNMHPESDRPYTQVFRDIWENQFLFWSIIFGFVSVFPVVYIPVINDKVFLHKGIDYEWGIAVALTLAFWVGAELYKWSKRVYYRRASVKKTDEKDLESCSGHSVFDEYSRANTMVKVKTGSFSSQEKK